MWKNEILPPFLDYLKNYNETIMKRTGDPPKKVSFFGLVLYSLHRFADGILRYLDKVDPMGANAALISQPLPGIIASKDLGKTQLVSNAFETHFGISDVGVTRYCIVGVAIGPHTDNHTGLSPRKHSKIASIVAQSPEVYSRTISSSLKIQYGHLLYGQFVVEMNAFNGGP